MSVVTRMNPGAHNQQVMSPSGSAQHVNPPVPTAAGSSTPFGGIQFTQATRIDMPMQLAETVKASALDAALLSDVKAAIVELDSRLHHRTSVLGQAASSLHTGYNALSENIHRAQQGHDAHNSFLNTLIQKNQDLLFAMSSRRPGNASQR